MKSKIIIFQIIIGLITTSCLKTNDFDPKKAKNDIEVNLPFTLGSANFAFNDLTKDFNGINQSFKKSMTLDPISISNINKLLQSPLSKAANSFPEPNRSAILAADGETIPEFDAISNIDLGVQDSIILEGFTRATFNSGTIAIKITNNWGFNVSGATIEVTNSANSNKEILVYGSIPNGGSATKTINLVGKTLGNVIKSTVYNVSAPAQTNIPINLSNSLNIAVTSNNLDIISGVADIPAQTINESIEETLSFGEQNISVNSVKIDSGQLVIDIVKYKFNVSSNITITVPNLKDPTGADFTTSYTNLNENSTDTRKEFSLTGYSVVLSNNNTIEASIVATVPAKDSTLFSSTDSVIALLDLKNLKFSEISLVTDPATIANTSLTDEFEFSLGSELDDLKGITLVFEATNTFPIDTVRIDYTDSIGNILGTFVNFEGLSQGKPIQQEIAFNGATLENLKKATKLKVAGGLFIGNSSEITIKSSDFFKFTAGIKARIKL